MAGLPARVAAAYDSRTAWAPAWSGPVSGTAVHGPCMRLASHACSQQTFETCSSYSRLTSQITPCMLSGDRVAQERHYRVLHQKHQAIFSCLTNQFTSAACISKAICEDNRENARWQARILITRQHWGPSGHLSTCPAYMATMPFSRTSQSSRHTEDFDWQSVAQRPPPPEEHIGLSTRCGKLKTPAPYSFLSCITLCRC